MNHKLPIRYALRQELDGSWTVYDIFTGVAYAERTLTAFGMPQEFAERLAYLLNLEYRARLNLLDGKTRHMGRM